MIPAVSRYAEVARRMFGDTEWIPDRSHLAALLDREYPHVADLDFNRYFAMVREEGAVGRAAAPAEAWCDTNAPSGWLYVHGSPHGGGVFMFRARAEADAFAARFPAKREDILPAVLPDHREVPGAGLHVVPLGWHRTKDVGHQADPTLKVFLDEARRRVRPYVSDGVWSVGPSWQQGQRHGGYYVNGEYRQVHARFTHRSDADAFRAAIADDPVAAPAREGWHAVDVGTRDWGASRDVEFAFAEESRWCRQNGVGWNWTVDCAGTGNADENPTRILFRYAEHAEAFGAAMAPEGPRP